jgi:hypothetical protein
MKKFTLSLLSVLLIGISILSGCKQQTPKIGILMHSSDEKVKTYLLESLTKRGTEVLISEEVDNNQEKQILQVDYCID